MVRFILAVFMLISFSFVAQADQYRKVSHWSLPWYNAPQAGTIYNSQEYPGTVWVIENYYNACSYCNDNAPVVNSLAESYKDNEKVQFIDLSIDKQDSAYASWISKYHPNHPVLKDANRTLTGQLGTTGYPTSYIIDCNMNVRWTHIGTWDQGSLAEIKTEVATALQVVCPL